MIYGLFNRNKLIEQIFVFFKNMLDFYLTIRYNFTIDEQSRMWRVVSPERRSMRMLEQIYIFFLYILLIELAFIIVLVVSLFVALVITLKKLNSKKSTSLIILYKLTACHISVVAHLFYNYYTILLFKCQ